LDTVAGSIGLASFLYFLNRLMEAGGLMQPPSLID
jgi:hypothetical protein